MGDQYVFTENIWGQTVIEKRTSSADIIGGTLALLAFAGGSVWQSIKQSNAQIYIENALNSAKKGDFEEAIADASRVVKMYPNDPESYTIRGSCYWSAGNHSSALEDFSKAIALNNSNDDFYNLRGQCYLELGHLKRAISDFIQATRLQPNQHDGYLWLGIALRELGDLDLSIGNLNRAIQLNPSDENTYRERGITYVEVNAYQKAILDFSCVLKLTPNSAEDYKLRGETYRLMGEEEKGGADFEQASRIEEAERVRNQSKKFTGQTKETAIKTKNPFQGTWTCSHCGGEVEENAEICPHCEWGF